MDEERQHQLERELADLRIEVAELKVKAGELDRIRGVIVDVATKTDIHEILEGLKTIRTTQKDMWATLRTVAARVSYIAIAAGLAITMLGNNDTFQQFLSKLPG